MQENPDYDEKRAELIEDAQETKAELEAQESEMLSAVASGEDGIEVGDTETVQVGEVTVTVKSYMPGETMNEIKTAQRLAERENVEAALDSVHTMCEGLTVVTERIEHAESGTVYTEKERIRGFWKGMFEKWGVSGFQQAAQKVLEPANEDMEDKADAAQSFRGH